MPATIIITCPKCKSQLRGPSDLQGKKVRCKGCGQAFIIDASVPSKPEQSAPPAPASAAPTKASGATGKTALPEPPAPNERPGVYAFISDDEADKIMTQAKSKAPPAADVRAVRGKDHFGSDGKPYSMTDVNLLPRCAYCAAELPSEDTIVCLNCGYNMQTRTRVEPKRTYAITPQDIFIWRLPGIICAVVCLLFVAFVAFLWLGLERLAEHNKNAWWTFLAALWFEIWGSVFAGFIIWFTGYLAYMRLVVNRNPPEEEKL